MRVERFEDLITWQMAMDLVVRAYEISKDAPFSRDFVLRDQFHGAAISIPSNIAEGFERGSRSESSVLNDAEEVSRIVGKLRVAVGKNRARAQ